MPTFQVKRLRTIVDQYKTLLNGALVVQGFSKIEKSRQNYIADCIKHLTTAPLDSLEQYTPSWQPWSQQTWEVDADPYKEILKRAIACTVDYKLSKNGLKLHKSLWKKVEQSDDGCTALKTYDVPREFVIDAVKEYGTKVEFNVSYQKIRSLESSSSRDVPASDAGIRSDWDKIREKAGVSGSGETAKSTAATGGLSSAAPGQEDGERGSSRGGEVIATEASSGTINGTETLVSAGRKRKFEEVEEEEEEEDDVDMDISIEIDDEDEGSHEEGEVQDESDPEHTDVLPDNLVAPYGSAIEAFETEKKQTKEGLEGHEGESEEGDHDEGPIIISLGEPAGFILDYTKRRKPGNDEDREFVPSYTRKELTQSQGVRFCRNCMSSAHTQQDCPLPLNPQMLGANEADAAADKPPMYRRYHLTLAGAHTVSKCRPGLIGPELREALGIGEREDPPWAEKMRREIGYPPGWRKWKLAGEGSAELYVKIEEDDWGTEQGVNGVDADQDEDEEGLFKIYRSEEDVEVLSISPSRKKKPNGNAERPGNATTDSTTSASSEMASQYYGNDTSSIDGYGYPYYGNHGSYDASHQYSQHAQHSQHSQWWSENAYASGPESWRDVQFDLSVPGYDLYSYHDQYQHSTTSAGDSAYERHQDQYQQHQNRDRGHSDHSRWSDQ
ncbi:Zinc finger CCHC domain-containing protein 8, partial [Quaeritorhiza haematococci]